MFDILLSRIHNWDPIYLYVVSEGKPSIVILVITDTENQTTTILMVSPPNLEHIAYLVARVYELLSLEV